MKKHARQKKIRLRKNFLPTFALINGLWLAVFSIVYYVNPGRPGAIILFFIALFFALFFTLATIFLNSRRGLLSTFLILIFLFLRYIGIGNVFQLIVLLALFVVVEYYFWNNKPN